MWIDLYRVIGAGMDLALRCGIAGGDESRVVVDAPSSGRGSSE
jgi:hypothetical protein